MEKNQVCEFLEYIRKENPEREIVIILDNCSAHRAHFTIAFAKEINIKLVFIPPYSPNLNPIEYIWKSIKKEISKTFIRDLDHMRDVIRENFRNFSSSKSFAKSWIETFLDEDYKCNLLSS